MKQEDFCVKKYRVELTNNKNFIKDYADADGPLPFGSNT